MSAPDDDVDPLELPWSDPRADVWGQLRQAAARRWIADIDLYPTRDRYVASAGDILADIAVAREAAKVADPEARALPRDVLMSHDFADHVRRTLDPRVLGEHRPGLGWPTGQDIFGLPVFIDPRVPPGMAFLRGADGSVTMLDARAAIFPPPSPSSAAQGTTATVDPQLRIAALCVISAFVIAGLLAAALVVVFASRADWASTAWACATVGVTFAGAVLAHRFGRA